MTARPWKSAEILGKDDVAAGGNLRREIAGQFKGAQHSFLRVLTSTVAISGAFLLVLFIAVTGLRITSRELASVKLFAIAGGVAAAAGRLGGTGASA